MVRTVLDVFQESVPEAFAFLETRHGYRLIRDDDYSFTAIAPHGDIVIELDWGSVVVSVRPAETGRSVRLSFIVGATDPEILFLPRYPWGPSEAADEVHRQAGLLRQYCTPVLSGDYSDWATMESHQDRVLEQWRCESENLVREARLKLVRRRADTAFTERSYSEAAQLYASIAEDLDDAERRRLDYARRRVLIVPVRRRPRLEEIA
jgi:hypothetical protein